MGGDLQWQSLKLQKSMVAVSLFLVASNSNEQHLPIEAVQHHTVNADNVIIKEGSSKKGWEITTI